MSTLKFLVGPVASGKTIDLIVRANQLQSIKGTEHVLIFKPSIDTRFSPKIVKSASGLQINLTHLISPADNLYDMDLTAVSHIFVDEIQFFTVAQIEQLREISLLKNIDIYCYGLLNDFKLNMFDASRRLLELCDTFEQIKTYCLMCKESGCSSTPNEASHNLRIIKYENEVKPVVEGESICIGGIDTFLPVCFSCYFKCTKTFIEKK